MDYQYRITFFDDDNNEVGEEQVSAPGHWEACEEGWRIIPEGSTDFQVQEVEDAKSTV